MSTVKMKTIHPHKHGQTNIIPYAGKVTISTEGEIEVSSMDIAEKIVKADIGFNIIASVKVEVKKDEEGKEPKREELKEKSEDDGLNREEKESIGDDEDNDELIKALDSSEMTLAKLQETAKSFPRAEWGSLRKAELIDYLKGKLAA